MYITITAKYCLACYLLLLQGELSDVRVAVSEALGGNSNTGAIQDRYSCILRRIYVQERFEGYAVSAPRNDEQYHFLVTTIESAKVSVK